MDGVSADRQSGIFSYSYTIWLTDYVDVIKPAIKSIVNLIPKGSILLKEHC